MHLKSSQRQTNIKPDTKQLNIVVTLHYPSDLENRQYVSSSVLIMLKQFN